MYMYMYLVLGISYKNILFYLKFTKINPEILWINFIADFESLGVM